MVDRHRFWPLGRFPPTRNSRRSPIREIHDNQDLLLPNQKPSQPNGDLLFEYIRKTERERESTEGLPVT